MLSYREKEAAELKKDRRSPRQLWNALLPSLRHSGGRKSRVAVPVNYGMLSYDRFFVHFKHIACRSPRQLWNALLRTSVSEPALCTRRSPRQLWNALLLKSCEQNIRICLSQSPSIMECSPTGALTIIGAFLIVAVPVNYGMLSYPKV